VPMSRRGSRRGLSLQVRSGGGSASVEPRTGWRIACGETFEFRLVNRVLHGIGFGQVYFRFWVGRVHRVFLSIRPCSASEDQYCILCARFARNGRRVTSCSTRTTRGAATEVHILPQLSPDTQAGVRLNLPARSTNFVRLVQADHRTVPYQMVQRLSLPGQRPGLRFDGARTQRRRRL
jgi:hypothetical protein